MEVKDMNAALEQDRIYTYRDYLKFGEDVRCEIIDGVVYDLLPAPGSLHQGRLMTLATIIGSYFLNKKCKAFVAPFDVRLPKKGEKSKDTSNVVQPDIVVICDAKKVDSKGCKGAPDWIIEIISPSSNRRDRRDKFNLYENSGVNEYWIVNPKTKKLSVFILDKKEGLYGSEEVYGLGQTVYPSMFPDLIIDLDLVFKD
jgi:Uma2 family endonuclease